MEKTLPVYMYVWGSCLGDPLPSEIRKCVHYSADVTPSMSLQSVPLTLSTRTGDHILNNLADEA